ncbi:hypothetical protein SEVIR_2G309232v4 [Setaria viridis]
MPYQLVPETSAGVSPSSPMADLGNGPATNSAKLDCIIAQLSTINNRLDAHDHRITRTEKFQTGGDDSEITGKVPPGGERRASGRGGGGSGDDNGNSGGYDGAPRDRYTRHDGAWRQPRPPKLSFPKYDGETDPLPWLNSCDIFLRGHGTMDEEKVWMASLHLKGVASQ